MAKNEAQIDIDLFNYLTNDKSFSQEWKTKKIENKSITNILSVATKSNTGKNRGEPDLIYFNENKKILILIENKDSIKDHVGSNVKNHAIAGIKHYLKFFLKDKLQDKDELTIRFLENFKIIGIAFSGNIKDEHNHLIDTFIIQDDKIKDIFVNEFQNEEDYLALFENLDLELISNNISKSSGEINRMLRNVDSQKRPVLLSALMICLYEKENVKNDFKISYQNYQTSTIISNIPITINTILQKEEISQDKIDILNNELSFIKTDSDLNNSNILNDILQELENNVIPLFNKKTSYDIIGKFYEEFLRYAGIANVKKGIVLTPNHITTLFTQLIPIKANDKIFDACCGTGAFLISGMNKLIDSISHSSIADKTKRINNVKQNQLLGFEKSNTMYSLAISNMLFRGDGKSKIHNIDFFSSEATNILEVEKPTIGFINPPYGGLDNKKNPTKKEIQFLEKMLDSVSRYGVIIAPQSVFFKDDIVRNRILTKHTLKAVINMPKELFQPNASTHTAIGIFETHLSHNDKEVVFYDLKDDGFVLSKNKGRTDVYNKWSEIKNTLFKKLNNPQQYNNNTNLVYRSIKSDNEWILQAHQKTDYSNIDKVDFSKTLKIHLIFEIKRKFNLLFKDIDELSFMDILNNNKIDSTSLSEKNTSLNNVLWQDFKISDLFVLEKGERLTEADRITGDIPLITASSYNNGITSFIDKNTFKNRKSLFNEKITIDMFGNVFYHKYHYFSDDNIHTLIFNDELNTYLNEYVCIFLMAILNKISVKYGFGRQVRLHRLNNEIISLPVDKNNKPNWQFMENYIKSLPYSKSL
jgi:type I restriction enzyme M protein